MDIFDNCRICLLEISHEPIKMTRIILLFLEKTLQLTNVTKPSPKENFKRNLCAPCFNRISEFQDFLEQCKDSDEFWKTQFDVLKGTSGENTLSFEETVLPVVEDNNSLEADTTVSTTNLRGPLYIQSEEKDENDFHSYKPIVQLEQCLQYEEKGNNDFPSPTPSQINDETSHTDDFNNSIDLTNWTEETDGEGVKENMQSICNPNTRDINDEIIEYEYQEEEEEAQIDEISAVDETESTDICGIVYLSLAFQKVESEISSESTTITKTVEETIEHSESTQKPQNTYFLTTSLDEHGKVKMTYKCSKCDKSFNRIYDIESHYNIHNGVKPFTCDVCGKSFRQKNILTTHQALHFGKKVECAECGKKFARRSQLILHYRMHRDEKPFVCDVDGCQGAFRQRKQLIDHSFIHTGEKNFQCATCEKFFYTRKRLQDHLYKIHSQHRYRCELCEKAFLKPHMLKHHMVTVHNVEMDDVSHLKTVIDLEMPIKKRS